MNNYIYMNMFEYVVFKLKALEGHERQGLRPVQWPRDVGEVDVESAHGGGEGHDDGAEGEEEEADVGHEAAADQHLKT